jgi:hypothetical protein
MNMLVSGDSTLGMGATEIGAAIRFTLRNAPESSSRFRIRANHRSRHTPCSVTSEKRKS